MPVETVGLYYKLGKGYGDSINLLRILELHERRGFRYRIRGWSDCMNWILGTYADTQAIGSLNLPLHHHVHMPDVGKPWDYNEISVNVCGQGTQTGLPLQDIGTKETLWDELIAARPRMPIVPQSDRDTAAVMLDLPRPITLFHPQGYSYRAEKSLTLHQIPDYAAHIADVTGGSVLVFNHYYNLGEQIHPRVSLLPSVISFPLTTAVIEAADCLVGIDSAPLHLARLTETPTVGMWFSRHSYFSRYTIPASNALNLVPSGFDDWTDKLDRELWQVRSGGHWQVTKESVASAVMECLAK